MPDHIYTMPHGPQRTTAVHEWLNTRAAEKPEGAALTEAGDRAARPRDLAKNAEEALDPANPFMGNGFAGNVDGYIPEMSYTTKIKVPEGAEMWRIDPDGTQQLAAVFRDGSWHVIVEQPSGIVP
ncbi:MAG: hypothetical protein FWD18_08660 [Micrococcales bacterium]|nr:hypothetical protein [Micrococcales bacterium]